MALTHDGELARPLLGGDDLQRGGDGLDADDGLVGVVGAWHGQLQVAAHQQLRRDVLELQGGELQWTDGRTEKRTVCKSSAVSKHTLVSFSPENVPAPLQNAER